METAVGAARPEAAPPGAGAPVPAPPAQPATGAPPDDLTRLLETEARLAAELRVARDAAAALVAAAHAHAAELEAGLAVELERGAKTLEASIAAEQQRRCAELAAAGATRIAAFDALSGGGAALERLVAVAVETLLAEDTA